MYMRIEIDGPNLLLGPNLTRIIFRLKKWIKFEIKINK